MWCYFAYFLRFDEDIIKECLGILILPDRCRFTNDDVIWKQMLYRMLCDLRERPEYAEQREAIESRYPSKESMEDLVKRFKEQSEH